MQICTCGQPLLLAIDDVTVVLVTGEKIPFRRATDYVACDQCLASYPVSEIRRQASLAGQIRLTS